MKRDKERISHTPLCFIHVCFKSTKLQLNISCVTSDSTYIYIYESKKDIKEVVVF